MTSPFMKSRRDVLQSMMLGVAATALPRFAFAGADTDSRFVLVILRGALDGLAAVPPVGDSDYAAQRGQLAITASEHKLDSMFALNPAFDNLYRRYQEKELIVMHAVASPYRERSHFDGQDPLENGTTNPHGKRDGWLNRLLPALSHHSGPEQVAIALSQNIPLVLRGDARVGSWAPSQLPEADSDTLDRIIDLYSTDPVLSSRLQSALSANGMAAGGMAKGGARDPLGQFNTVAAAAGRLLAPADGSRIAVIEVNGWDTHANQGANDGQLFNRLQALDRGLDTLRTSLGKAWSQTAVMIVTEFGRTVAINGTRGTDHGTATCALLLGGAVAGGRVIADWPGLSKSALYQGRDLRPTLDLRSVFKGVLTAHLHAKESELNRLVFPDSSGAKALGGLIRA